VVAFYGQLAAHQLGDDAPPRPAPEPVPDAAELARFNQNELVRATRIFLDLGYRDQSKVFMLSLADNAATPTQFAMLAAVAEAGGRIDLAVAVAKRAIDAGTPLMIRGYPVASLPSGGTAEHSLLLAITRQESAFDRAAVSRAGARGLMQLMPTTASDVARKMRLPFSTERLTTDGTYNVLLGRAYLEKLIDDFGDSYGLAIAAYNAGPGRVRQWLRDYVDPRGGRYRDGRLDREHSDQRDAKLRSTRARNPADLSRPDRPQIGLFAGQRPGPLSPRPPSRLLKYAALSRTDLRRPAIMNCIGDFVSRHLPRICGKISPLGWKIDSQPARVPTAITNLSCELGVFMVNA
jgi:soluble lytic murein transglycosylase-like protein